MNVHKFLLYIQEFKSLYTKEEYNQLMREWHKDYEDYLISLVDYDNDDEWVQSAKCNGGPYLKNHQNRPKMAILRILCEYIKTKKAV